MAGRKFGTNGQEYLTWSMNAWLPALVAERYRNSNIMVFSTGCVYSFAPLHSGGSLETNLLNPKGEYAMSCLGRERMFEYAANTYGTKTFLYRLSYAIDLRYGVFYDIVNWIMNGEPIPVSTPVFNCIWQGDANEIAIRGLLHCESPANKVNVTGPELVSVRYAAEKLGEYLGRTPTFKGEEQNDCYHFNTAKMVELFGYPTKGIDEMLKMQADWIISGGRSSDKPTHFEVRGGKF